VDNATRSQIELTLKFVEGVAETSELPVDFRQPEILEAWQVYRRERADGAEAPASAPEVQSAST
jgi:hypothetical protein